MRTDEAGDVSVRTEKISRVEKVKNHISFYDKSIKLLAETWRNIWKIQLEAVWENCQSAMAGKTTNTPGECTFIENYVHLTIRTVTQRLNTDTKWTSDNNIYHKTLFWCFFKHEYCFTEVAFTPSHVLFVQLCMLLVSC